MRSFDVNATRACMAGRTFYVIGNSIPRQTAFGLLDMLGANTTSGNQQKRLCPKIAHDWGASCSSEIADVKIRYLYLNWVDGFDYGDRGGFPYHYHKKINSTVNTPYFYYPDHGLHIQTGDDSCRNKRVRTCLENFFINSTEKDVLVFSFGMAYVPIHPPENSNQRQFRLWTWEEEQNSNISTLNTRLWLTASAVNFYRHLSVTFKGSMFRMTMSPVRDFDKNVYIRYDSKVLKKIDDIVAEFMQPGSEQVPLYTIDQWAINETRLHLYEDSMHFNGNLPYATLHQVLNEIC